MRFALSTEQTSFASVLHDFLAAGERDLDAIGLAEVTDPVDLVVMFEELGHHAVPGPLIETFAVLPTLGLKHEGSFHGPEVHESSLHVCSVAFPPVVPYAVEAERYFLVEGDTLRSAVPTAAVSSVDPSRELFELAGGAVIGAVDGGRAVNLGVLACSAQLLGLGRAMLEMAVEYAKVRVQFGKPIGSFQAVKHQLANVLIGLELARPLVFGAAVTMSTRDVSAAKVAVADAAWQAARTALQVHGAIGYTAEHQLSRFLLQTRALRTAWGSPSLHRTRVLEAL